MTREFAILIVDDDLDLASNIQDILEAEGYSTAVAKDGQTALALCEEKQFDLALIDVRLPDVPGVELVGKLTKLLPAMEDIIITGYASVDSAVEAIRHRNIVAYETKPLNMNHLVALIRQVDQRKQAEEQLRHSQLLASLGEMTAGITHEMGNPLASIVLYSEVAMKGDVSRQTMKDLKVIQNEAKRAGKLMKDLLAYSRKLEPKMRRLNLHSVIKKVLDMRRYQHKVHNIRTATHLLDDPLYIKGDPFQLTQVFLNLIINAEEALREHKGGSIIVATEIDGEWARVSIADDGTGIPEENLSQVFHPFFTTKEVGEGTGLGLSTCYGIITAQGGLIHAGNNEMGGAIFTVQLPLAGMGRQGISPLEIKEASS